MVHCRVTHCVLLTLRAAYNESTDTQNLRKGHWEKGGEKSHMEKHVTGVNRGPGEAGPRASIWKVSFRTEVSAQ